MANVNNDVNTKLSSCDPTHETTTNIRDLLPCPDVCVICLDRVSEKATAQPCKHNQFDLACLGTWLQNQRVCPLCKREVSAIRYNDTRTGETHIIQLSVDQIPRRSAENIRQRRACYTNDTSNTRRIQATRAERKYNEALKVRRQVYEFQLFSLYVGANKLNGYRNIAPSSFNDDEKLISRAKVWIRRELAVFDFLNPNSQTFGRTDRRATNPEFLLEYIIAIIRSIDLKGSAGQAQELLKDFLGKDNTKVFCHELDSWLRSPYERLEDWDRNVQYPLQG